MIVTENAYLAYENPHDLSAFAEADVEIEIEASWSFDDHELDELKVRHVHVVRSEGQFPPGGIERLAREFLDDLRDEIAERVVGARGPGPVYR